MRILQKRGMMSMMLPISAKEVDGMRPLLPFLLPRDQLELLNNGQKLARDLPQMALKEKHGTNKITGEDIQHIEVTPSHEATTLPRRSIERGGMSQLIASEITPCTRVLAGTTQTLTMLDHGDMM